MLRQKQQGMVVSLCNNWEAAAALLTKNDK